MQIIGIKNISAQVPKEFSLSQNYPNPFNASTDIRFQLSVVSQVSLKIYDVLGREEETLINEKLNAGTYEVNWNASKYTSGIYFYKLQSDRFTETKKMLLTK